MYLSVSAVLVTEFNVFSRDSNTIYYKFVEHRRFVNPQNKLRTHFSPFFFQYFHFRRPDPANPTKYLPPTPRLQSKPYPAIHFCNKKTLLVRLHKLIYHRHHPVLTHPHFYHPLLRYQHSTTINTTAKI